MDALAELSEALRKMLGVGSTAEDVLHQDEIATCQLTETVDVRASAQYADNDQSVAESGFAAYIRSLVRSIDEVARDEADQDVLDALGELTEVLPKMVAAAATAEDVLPWPYRGIGDFQSEIEELIDMITTAAAGGEVDWEVRSARKAIKVIEDFIRAVESWAAMGAANETVLATGEDEEEAVDEEEGFLEDQIQQQMYEEDFQDELDVLATGEAEEDGEVFFGDQVQQEMYEEAFQDELDYQEMTFSIDEALDEFRQEVAGCSDEHPRTGFLGRYGFSTDQHFYQLMSGAL